MKIRSRWAIRMVGRLIAISARIYFRLFVTHRVVMHTPGVEPFCSNSKEFFLYCLWHDSILGIIFGKQPVDMAGLVSRHEDGSYVADAMDCVGLTPIRGSSKHGGAVAMKQMMDAASRLHIAIATDGPRGPHHVVKEGIVFLASQTGRRIVPVAIAASRAWRPWSKWTDMVIPKPFSTMYVVASEPMTIPPGIERAERDVWKKKLQAEMEAMTELADRLARERNSQPNGGIPLPSADTTIRRAA